MFQNAALCVVFGLSLFAGGVANAIYAANNAGIIYDICDQSTDIDNDICDAFRRVRDSEAAAAVSSEKIIWHKPHDSYIPYTYIHIVRKVSVKLKLAVAVSIPPKLNPSNVLLSIIIFNTCIWSNFNLSAFKIGISVYSTKI